MAEDEFPRSSPSEAVARLEGEEDGEESVPREAVDEQADWEPDGATLRCGEAVRDLPVFTDLEKFSATPSVCQLRARCMVLGRRRLRSRCAFLGR